MEQRVAGIPGVAATALSIGTPFRNNIGTAFQGPGVDSTPDDMDGAYLAAVTPGYFKTLGTEVLRGRGFTSADVAGSPRVLVVSQTFARRVWPEQDPLGKCLSIGTREAPCRVVVGVVEDGRQDRVTNPSAQTFVPLTQADDPALAMPITSLLIRTDGPAEALLGPVRRAIQATAPDLPFVTIEPMATIIGDQIRPWRLGAQLFGLFGGLALLLGAVGVYGVLSYAMSLRTHEMGVRLALGAGRRHLLGLVVGRGLRVALVGVLIGAVGALLAGKALASLVYGVSPYDPGNLLLVVGLLLLVSAGASFLPAWRATRVNPMVALREE
jgi:predicted permease